MTQRKEEPMKKLMYIMVMIYFINSVLFASVPLYAAQPTPTTGSIKVTYTYEGTPLEGANFWCEKIATVDISQSTQLATYSVDSPYNSILVNGKSLATALEEQRNWESCVQAVSDQLEITGYSSAQLQVGSKGITNLSFLELGIYIIEFEEFVVEDSDGTTTTYKANSFLVSVPNKVEVTDDWDYTIEATPKVMSAEVVKPQVGDQSGGNVDGDQDAGNEDGSLDEDDGVLDDSLEEDEEDLLDEEIAPKTLTVIKFWESGLGMIDTTYEVTVELYGNDVKYNEQILSDDNNWAYTWTNLDGSMDWEVKEKDVLEGYVASYAPNVYGIGLTNSAVLSATLPQTGLVQAPIAILGGVGFLLMGVGIVVIRRGQRHE